jgi:hypothetical protein
MAAPEPGPALTGGRGVDRAIYACTREHHHAPRDAHCFRQNRASGRSCRYCAWPRGSPRSGRAGASLVTRLPCGRRSRRRDDIAAVLETRLSLVRDYGVRTHHCCDPCPSARDWRQEMVAFSSSLSAVRTAECLGEDTVLMVVARRGSDVRRNRVSRVLGRAWGAGGGGVVGDGGRSPGQT